MAKIYESLLVTRYILYYEKLYLAWPPMAIYLSTWNSAIERGFIYVQKYKVLFGN